MDNIFYIKFVLFFYVEKIFFLFSSLSYLPKCALTLRKANMISLLLYFLRKNRKIEIYHFWTPKPKFLLEMFMLYISQHSVLSVGYKTTCTIQVRLYMWTLLKFLTKCFVEKKVVNERNDLGVPCTFSRYCQSWIRLK